MTAPDLDLGAAPWIVGHRGAAGEAPENSLDSLLLAVEQGVDMVEFDLQMTADGRLVACHDWTLERMGGADLTIEEETLEVLRRIEISGPFRKSGLERRLATFEEILSRLPQEVPLNLELKRRLADSETLVNRLATALGDRAHLLISSFDWKLLAATRQALSDAALAPLGGRRADPDALLAAADQLDAWSVHCRYSLATADLVAKARQAGRPVVAYTVNDAPAARRLFERGVQGVFSDFPGRLRRQLEEEG